MAEVKEEERIARLEEKVDSIDKRIDRVEQRLDRIEDAVKNLRKEIYRLDKKSTVLILILIFLTIFLNQNSLEFIFQVFGLISNDNQTPANFTNSLNR